ncbi:hypothetical protein A4R35_10335 [Thermogemmatispora tikiterensis]|uniref:Uncharacterized protein n=1 Tax=Thermogemmatispora tikiterensis TaxID=1825093 RepID=A0A328VIJ7_9CHLR|nr:hypothetical protein A4R35_10335 [Thermogemmatispora tikiterensis]
MRSARAKARQTLLTERAAWRGLATGEQLVAGPLQSESQDRRGLAGTAQPRRCEDLSPRLLTQRSSKGFRHTPRATGPGGPMAAEKPSWSWIAVC